jgi:hypothetical protein
VHDFGDDKIVLFRFWEVWTRLVELEVCWAGGCSFGSAAHFSDDLGKPSQAASPSGSTLSDTSPSNLPAGRPPNLNIKTNPSPNPILNPKPQTQFQTLKMFINF